MHMMILSSETSCLSCIPVKEGHQDTADESLTKAQRASIQSVLASVMCVCVGMGGHSRPHQSDNYTF